MQYLASIVEGATVIRLFELQATTPLPKRNAYPDIDRRSSMLAPQSASEKPSRRKFRRYWRIGSTRRDERQGGVPTIDCGRSTFAVAQWVDQSPIRCTMCKGLLSRTKTTQICTRRHPYAPTHPSFKRTSSHPEPRQARAHRTTTSIAILWPSSNTNTIQNSKRVRIISEQTGVNAETREDKRVRGADERLQRMI